MPMPSKREGVSACRLRIEQGNK